MLTKSQQSSNFSSEFLTSSLNPTETHPRTRTNNVVAQELEKKRT